MPTIVKFAKLKRKKEVFPVYFCVFDENWGCNVWTDGEGNAYFENELIFVQKEPQKYIKNYNNFLKELKNGTQKK